MKIYEKIAKQAELKEQRAKLAALRSEREQTQKALEEVQRTFESEDLSADELMALREKTEPIGERDDELGEQISELEGKVKELEAELEETEEPATETAGERTTAMDTVMTREKTREYLRTGEYYQLPEVRSFYESLKQARAVTGGTYTVPNAVINKIYDIVGDYTTLYPLVDKVGVKGTARILIDADSGTATWSEQGGSFTASDVGTISYVDFDGYKLGKLVLVDNYLLDDSIINLDEYVTRKIAKAIAKALDSAILNGHGRTGDYYEPTGILTAIAAETGTPKIKSVEKGASCLINTVKQISAIDTGADTPGEIVAVMKRATYYDIFFAYSVQVNSSGNVVGKLPNLTNPDLIGIRVVFSEHMPANTVLFGDFEKYTLVDRQDITIDRSVDYAFAADQTAFRGKARFDGKPTKLGGFVQVNLVDPT